MDMLLEELPVGLVNELVINGEPVNLSTGYIVEQEKITDVNSENGKYYLIILTGTGLTYNFDSEDFVGKGDFLLIGIHAFVLLAEKVFYTIQASDKIGSSFAIVIRNYDTKINQGDANYTARNGTIAVKKNKENTVLVLISRCWCCMIMKRAQKLRLMQSDLLKVF